MGVIRTKYGRTEIKAINLPATNHTLVIAPKFKGARVDFIVPDGQIAEKIAADKELRRTMYNTIREEYNLYRSFLS
jgi:hypothetical protein